MIISNQPKNIHIPYGPKQLPWYEQTPFWVKSNVTHPLEDALDFYVHVPPKDVKRDFHGFKYK